MSHSAQMAKVNMYEKTVLNTVDLLPTHKIENDVEIQMFKSIC